MPAEYVVGILITAIVSLAGVIALLWKAFFSPLITKMLSLIETLQIEQPKQTAALEGIQQASELIVSSNKAIKHGTAEMVKGQREEMELLGKIQAGVIANANVCRMIEHKPG